MSNKSRRQWLPERKLRILLDALVSVTKTATDEADVVFLGYDSTVTSGKATPVAGVYWAKVNLSSATPVELHKVADTSASTSLAGGGSVQFARFDPPEIHGTDITFVAWDDSTPSEPGVYRANVVNPSTPVISTVANSSTSIPSGTGQFIAFQSATLDGSNVAFVGNGPQTSPPPNDPAIRQPGLYTWNGTTSTTSVVLDQNDEVPDYSAGSMDPTDPTRFFEFFFTPAT